MTGTISETGLTSWTAEPILRGLKPPIKDDKLIIWSFYQIQTKGQFYLFNISPHCSSAVAASYAANVVILIQRKHIIPMTTITETMSRIHELESLFVGIKEPRELSVTCFWKKMESKKLFFLAFFYD